MSAPPPAFRVTFSYPHEPCSALSRLLCWLFTGHDRCGTVPTETGYRVTCPCGWVGEVRRIPIHPLGETPHEKE